MDQTVVKTAPYFDLDALREETSRLARAYSGSGQDSSLRAALVERLRQLVDEARTEARADEIAGRGGSKPALREGWRENITLPPHEDKET